MTRKQTIRILIPGLALAVAAGYWLTSQTRISANPVAISPAVPVIDGYAKVREVPIWLSGLGPVQPLQVVTIKVRVDGQLDRVFFAEGQEVRAGTALAQAQPVPRTMAADYPSKPLRMIVPSAPCDL